jgi:Cytochrome c554 and c-prime
MSKDLLKAIPFAVGLIGIALIVGLPSGCGDQINQTDAPPHASDIPKAELPPKADGPAKQASAATPHTKPAPPTVKPLLKGWEKPAATLIFSGEQHGYMEPCGCSVTQSGGLSRRGDLIRQLNEKGWPFAAFDLGDLVKKDNQQNKIKYQVMLTALKDLGYKAMGLGPEELALERLEPGFLVTQGPGPGADPNQDGLGFVNANVEFTLFKDPSLRPAQIAKVVTINGHRIGVTAIFGKTLVAALFGDAGDPQIKVNDPAQSLPAAIAELKKQKAEVLVLLSHAEKSESVELAKKFPEFQLVATARGPEDGEDEFEPIGKTLLVVVGQKGKHVAVVGYYPDDKARPFRFELVDLDKERFHDTPKMLDRMREYQHILAGSYDAVLKDFAQPQHPSGDTFAGVETCKDCHTKAYAVWKDSKHAHAYESLITGREGTKNPVPRNHDPECINCHTTGWDPQGDFPYVSGFYSLEKTPKLKDQQCENCHGPAAKHVALELAWKKDPKAVNKGDVDAARKRAKLKVAEAEKTLCYKCHDYENDPNFSSATFPEYWEQIKHPGKD